MIDPDQFIFEPSRYVAGPWEVPPQVLEPELDRLRAWHPELQHWADSSLLVAWDCYSGQVCGLRAGSADIWRRVETFLTYLYIVQRNPHAFEGYLGVVGPGNERYPGLGSGDDASPTSRLYCLVSRPRDEGPSRRPTRDRDSSVCGGLAGHGFRLTNVL